MFVDSIFRSRNWIIEKWLFIDREEMNLNCHKNLLLVNWKRVLRLLSFSVNLIRVATNSTDFHLFFLVRKFIKLPRNRKFILSRRIFFIVVISVNFYVHFATRNDLYLSFCPKENQPNVRTISFLPNRMSAE